MEGETMLDAAYEVNGRTITDSASGISARPYGSGNWGDSFLVLIDEDASEWLFGNLPAGMYELGTDEWEPEDENLDAREAELAGMAAAIDWLTDDFGRGDIRTYFLARLRVDLPFERGSDVEDGTSIEARRVILQGMDIAQCEVCGEECRAAELEPEFSSTIPVMSVQRAPIVSHGHYQLASFDHGIRRPEELAVIQLRELDALGANIPESDRRAFLADDVPDFDNFEHWEWVFEAVDRAESNLPEGYAAVNDIDAGTWSLWAKDRNAFMTALDRYARER